MPRSSASNGVPLVRFEREITAKHSIKSANISPNAMHYC